MQEKIPQTPPKISLPVAVTSNPEQWAQQRQHKKSFSRWSNSKGWYVLRRTFGYRCSHCHVREIVTAASLVRGCCAARGKMCGSRDVLRGCLHPSRNHCMNRGYVYFLENVRNLQ